MLENDEKKYFLWTLLIAGIMSIVSLLVDYRISLGIVIGTLASLVNYGLLTLQMTMIVLNQQMNVIRFAIGYLIRFACLFIPLLFAVYRPEICNVWAVFVALMLFKVVMYVEGIRKKVL